MIRVSSFMGVILDTETAATIQSATKTTIMSMTTFSKEYVGNSKTDNEYYARYIKNQHRLPWENNIR